MSVTNEYAETRTGGTQTRPEDQFRDFQEETNPKVAAFYRMNHQHQTLEFVLRMKDTYTVPEKRTRRMAMWAMMEHLNTFVDDSDPDTSFTQMEHAMQTAERIRKDGHPRWMIATGFIHDAGKVLSVDYNEPQWAVVGDTFPVGCAWSDTIVFHEFFADNSDSEIPQYQTPNGIYEAGIGLDNVHLSFGHDEYLYHVVEDSSRLPIEALYMIRYHSCYPWHRDGAYTHLMSDQDGRMLPEVQKFNPYDLYSKADERPDVSALTPWYRELVDEFFPEPLAW
ncbi:MAG: inositol oxygenase [Chloroflexota bacterium]|nr:inositol oxygenase [Chloroflexota bacterium]